MDGGPAVVTDAQTAEAVQPGESSFHHPTVSAQPFLRFDTATGYTGHDAPAAQVGPAERIVVALVGVELGGPFSRAPPLASNSRHCLDERDEALAIMDVGAG